MVAQSSLLMQQQTRFDIWRTVEKEMPKKKYGSADLEKLVSNERRVRATNSSAPTDCKNLWLCCISPSCESGGGVE